jgi:hypothetical protein
MFCLIIFQKKRNKKVKNFEKNGPEKSELWPEKSDFGPEKSEPEKFHFKKWAGKVRIEAGKVRFWVGNV